MLWQREPGHHHEQLPAQCARRASFARLVRSATPARPSPNARRLVHGFTVRRRAQMPCQKSAATHQQRANGEHRGARCCAQGLLPIHCAHDGHARRRATAAAHGFPDAPRRAAPTMTAVPPRNADELASAGAYGWWRYGATFALCATTSLIALALQSLFDASNIVMLFLLAVVGVSFALRPWPCRPRGDRQRARIRLVLRAAAVHVRRSRCAIPLHVRRHADRRSRRRPADRAAALQAQASARSRSARPAGFSKWRVSFPLRWDASRSRRSASDSWRRCRK